MQFSEPDLQILSDIPVGRFEHTESVILPLLTPTQGYRAPSAGLCQEPALTRLPTEG